MNGSLFDIVFIGIFALVAVIIFFTIIMMFNPRLRGKMMSQQIKAGKYAIDESRDDLKNISDNIAYATKDGIKTTAGAIKEGFTQNKVFCKYCGNEIDADSKFCKKCGKEQ